MTSQAHFVRPPRTATWLVNLFTPADAGESILGDLFEEFSHIASNSGVAVARRWYWRQSVKTPTSFRHRIPCRSMVNHCRRGRRVFAAWVCLWAARQVIVGGYRQIPDVLVDSFHGLHLDAERNVDRAPHRGDVRWVCDRAGSQGKGNSCHDDASSSPLRVDWRCFRLGSHTSTHGCCVDAMVMR